MKEIKKKIKITRKMFDNVKLMIESKNPEDVEVGLESWKNMKPSELLTLLLVKTVYFENRVKAELKLFPNKPGPWDEILKRIDWDTVTDLERELITEQFEHIILNKPFIRDIKEYIDPIKIKLKK
jgi:hypothetical protein